MKLQFRFALVVLTLCALLYIPVFATSAPTIISASVNSAITQLTISGSGFSPSNTTPVVVLGNTTLALNSFSDTQIVAALPANEPAGSYSMSVTETAGGNKASTFGVTIGNQGPVGTTGPQGPQGPQGLIGPQGPQGAQGLSGMTGATGSQGPTIFKGTWNSTGIYTIGNEVQSSFVASSGPVGMFFNLTGQNNGDPWADNVQFQSALSLPADWIYCCGTLSTPSAAAEATLLDAIPPPPTSPSPQAGTFSGTVTLTPTVTGCTDIGVFVANQNVTSASGTVILDASENITSSTGIANELNGNLTGTVILDRVQFTGGENQMSFQGSVVWSTNGFNFTGTSVPGSEGTGGGCSWTLTLQFQM